MKNGKEIREFVETKQKEGYKTIWSIWEAFCREKEYCTYKTFRKYLQDEENRVLLNKKAKKTTFIAFERYDGRCNSMGIYKIYDYYKKLGGKCSKENFYKDIEKLSRNKANTGLLNNVGKAYFWCNTLRTMLGEKELPKVEWVECIPPSVKQTYLLEFLKLLREDFSEVAQRFFKEERNLSQKRDDDMMLYWLAHRDDGGKSRKKTFLVDKFCDEMRFYVNFKEWKDFVMDRDFCFTEVQKYSFNNISYDVFSKNTNLKKWFQKGFHDDFLGKN